LLDGTIVETYKTAAGLMKAYRVGGASTALLIEGVEAREVGTYVVVSEYADEPPDERPTGQRGQRVRHSGRRPRQRAVETQRGIGDKKQRKIGFGRVLLFRR
jgi:hypothetical protein